MSCKFSIIVPIYNVEKYLATCIESILNQKFTDFELILVNDGSTDSSLSICEKYAQSDSRVKVINKQNQGLFMARKSGIRQAVGEYIVHVDGDDSCTDNLLSCLSENIEKYNPDLIIYNYKRIDENNNCVDTIIFPLGKETHLFIADDKREILRKMIENHKLNSMCTKCAKRGIYDECETSEYDDVMMGEDLIYSMPLLRNSNRILAISEPFYNYRINRKGISRKIRTDYIYDYLKVRQCFFQTIDSLNYDDLKHPFIRKYVHGVCNYLMKLHLLNSFSQYKKIYLDVRNSQIQKTSMTYKRKWGLVNSFAWVMCNPIFYPISRLMAKLYYKSV